jgi:hypothetical protein
MTFPYSDGGKILVKIGSNIKGIALFAIPANIYNDADLNNEFNFIRKT